MTSVQNDWLFISTEFMGGAGEAGERRIWESVCSALKQTSQGVGFLNYRTFTSTKSRRWEPDILLLSRDWGLLIIEVKSVELSDIQVIKGHQWLMTGSFYKKKLVPFKQAERQLRQILKQYDKDPQFRRKIPSRVAIGLPLIKRNEWIKKFGGLDHPIVPPLIFADELGKVSLRKRLEKFGTSLTETGLSNKLYIAKFKTHFPYLHPWLALGSKILTSDFLPDFKSLTHFFSIFGCWEFVLMGMKMSSDRFHC